MAQAGYASADTAKGLLAAWPQTQPAALTAALVQAYPSPAQTPEQTAQGLHNQGVAAAACGPALLKAFPTLGVNDMASAMAKAGYLANDTAVGLKAAFPALSPLQMTLALKGAYP